MLNNVILFKSVYYSLTFIIIIDLFIKVVYLQQFLTIIYLLTFYEIFKTSAAETGHRFQYRLSYKLQTLFWKCIYIFSFWSTYDTL